MTSPSGPATWADRVFGSEIPYITYAVPFFFLLIAIEVAVDLWHRHKVYRLNDSIADLSCGIIDQMLKVLIHAAVLGIYVFIYEQLRITDVTQWSPVAKYAAVIVLCLGVDLCFYWHHRFAHEFALGWAAHSVHHQSEDFNLIVALRQSALEHHLTIFFYLPLALLGFPVSWFVAMFAFNLIWQFWCHTKLVGKLGPLEWIFVTPSHHRVHHARNPKYLDKNYGGTLIIWDRMFGTFQPEEEEPVYGVTKPLNSWNPVWANLSYWVELGKLAWQAPRWFDKIRIWFMPLNWRPAGLPPAPAPPEVSAGNVAKYDVKVSGPLFYYAVAQLALTFAIGFGFSLVVSTHANLAEVWDLAAFLLVSLMVVSGFMESQPWALPVEIARLLSMPLVAWHQSYGSAWQFGIITAAITISTLSALALFAGMRSAPQPLRTESATQAPVPKTASAA